MSRPLCRRTARAVVLAAVASLPAPLGRASGFAIFEQGARGMGFAGAYASQTEDPSAIFHNAAGIAFLKGRQLYFGATLIQPDSSFEGENPFPGVGVREQGDAGVTIPPAFDYSQQWSERLVLGLGVHVPFGLRTRWQNADTTFTGRFLSRRAEVRSLSLNPTLAYKLADRLAIGGGVDVRFSTVELDRNAGVINPFTQRLVDAALVELKSDTATSFGFNLGVLAKPAENLSVGFAYRHKVKTDFDGSADFTLLPTGNSQLDALVTLRLPSGPTPVTTRITFPALYSVGASYRWNDWTVAVQADFQQWSSFDTLPLDFLERPELSSTIEEHYGNSRIYRAGVERRLNDRFTLRGGYYYDKNPAPAESVSPLLPDADRHCIALGATVHFGSWRLEAANWLLLFKDRSTEGRNRDHYDGLYQTTAELFSLSFGFSF
ncbi:MAG: OmpP1/FadL family transporter [Vicinamibacteria bacterium]